MGDIIKVHVNRSFNPGINKINDLGGAGRKYEIRAIKLKNKVEGSALMTDHYAKRQLLDSINELRTKNGHDQINPNRAEFRNVRHMPDGQVVGDLIVH